MKLGAYTACLHDRTLPDALDVLAGMGLTSAEVNSGGFIPSPHCPVDGLLASAGQREDYLGVFAEKGVELTGLNCNGNPLNPLPGVGPKHADDLRRTITLAGRLGVAHVVTMSGSPGSDPDAKYPSWVVNAWDNVYMDVLDYQWSVAVPFWKEIDALARDNGVKVAIELHPQNLVFNVPTIERLVEATGATNVGVEMDTSHLMWQQMDVPTVIRRLGSLIYFAAAKDVALFDGVKTKGVLDNEFTRVPADDPEQGAHRLRALVQRLARRPGLALRRRRGRPPGRLLGRGAHRPAGRRPRHHDQHRARGRLDVRARRPGDGGHDPARGDGPALIPGPGNCHRRTCGSSGAPVVPGRRP